MNLLGVIDRVASHKPSEFVVPLPDAQQVHVFLFQNHIPLRFDIRVDIPGWWHFTPTDAKRLASGPSRPAYPSEIITYLAAAPRLRVIALMRLTDETWLCIPNNLADAQQKGWRDGAPRRLHLVSGALQAFDLVIARLVGDSLLYDEIDTRLPQADLRDAQAWVRANDETRPLLGRREILVAGAMLVDQVRQQREAAQAEAEHLRRMKVVLERQQATTDMDTRIRRSLGLMGATLDGWSELGDELVVRWEFDGRRAVTRVNRNLTVTSAGFCLAGTDSQHTLSDIVRVMEDARAFGRRDLPASYGGQEAYDNYNDE